MKTIFKGAVTYRISLALKQDGVPVDLTGYSSVALKMYEQGTNTLKWSHNATVDTAASGLAHYDTVAADLDTTGDYFTNVVITYTSGKILTLMDDFYRIIENQQSVVTPADLLAFMDIPSENAKSTSTIQRYIDQAETNLDLLQPSLVTSTDQRKIQLRQNLITIKAAVLYFMNMAEDNINPEVRIQKIKLWNEEYNEWMDRLNSTLSTTSTAGSGIVRRVINGTQTIVGSSTTSTTNPLATNTNASISLLPYSLNKAGSECSGLDGDTGRTLTLVNSKLAQAKAYFIFRNGALLDEADYSVSSIASGTIITFSSVNIFNSDTLIIKWFI